jgi:hypothetical protein
MDTSFEEEKFGGGMVLNPEEVKLQLQHRTGPVALR